MNIGEAAHASGISTKMIRYYEQIGLIPKASRTGGGYRVYKNSEVDMLRFIKRARNLGFSMPEIGELLSLWQDQHRMSANVKQIAQAHILELEQKIENMQDMLNTLQALVNSCAGDQQPDCPILADLEKP